MENKLKKSTDRITMPDEVKNNIMEKCTAKAKNDKFPNQTETVFEVEHVVSRPIFRTIAGIAACAVLVGGIGVGTHLISRNGLSVDPGSSEIAEGTTDPTNETNETTAESTTEYEDSASDTVSLADMTNMSYKLAATLLEEQGINPSIIFVSSNETAPDYIIRTEPPAGEKIEKGSTVILYVSSLNGNSESSSIDVNFDIPDTTKRFIYDRDPESPRILSDEQYTEIISTITNSISAEVSKEEIESKINNVTPEEQLGFGSYSIDWNSGDSWGELSVYDIGIVKYDIDYSGGSSELKYFSIDHVKFDTELRQLLGWNEGYCPFGTPYKMGLSYNGDELKGTKLRAVSNAFFGWDWSKTTVVDSFLNETPAYEFTSGNTIIKVYENGTIEWNHPKGENSDNNVHRAENVDGDTDNAYCTPICKRIEEALNY